VTAPLLVVGHAADRTGPPIYLRNLLGWLREHRPEVAVEVALPTGGELLDDLAALAPVTVFEPLPPEVDGEDRERLLSGAIDEAAWWARRREAALREMMEPFGGSRVVYATCAPAIELVRALPPAERVLLSHVHELEIGLVHRLPPRDRDLFLGGATRVFSVARAVTDHLVTRHGVDPDVVEHQPEMVDASRIVAATSDLDRAAARRARGLDPDHHVVGACGTIEFRKGTDLFLRTAWHLRRAGLARPVTFVWIGGDEAGIARARARAESWGVDDVVRFVGPQADPATWFALLDVFVMPSREDPFPLVCIEAAAAGTPVVAFDAGGIPELLEQGCGTVVPYPDVERLAAGVQALLEDEPHRVATGQRGRELTVAQHDVSVVAPRAWAAMERWL
jgi:glycosyltransferase involved in cell wall biosynthesis